MILDYKTWKRIFEADTSSVASVTKEVADFLRKEHKNLYVIEDFETIKRENEPLQVGCLIFDGEGKSVRLNFTEKGKLFSADFWKPSSGKPVSTSYFKDDDMSIVLPIVLKLFNDPSTVTIEEKIDNEQVTVISPKEEKATEKEDEVKIEGGYEISDPDTIFDDMKKYVNMVIDGEMFALIISGQSGVGKSFKTKKFLEERNLVKDRDYVVYKSKASAAGLYMLLYENNGKIILLDDIDSVFDSKDAINTLAGALDTEKNREISWAVARPIGANGQDIPKKFIFTGKVIFLTNVPLRKIDPKIRGRCFSLEVALGKDDMIQYMYSLIDDVKSASGAEIPTHVREHGMQLLAQAASELTSVELNLRTLIKAIAIVNICKGNDEIALRMIKQQCRKPNEKK